MNWLTILWPMIASASLTIAGIYLLIWLLQRDAWAYLMFAFLAFSTAVVAAIELWMMQSQTIVAFGTALRWFHVPVWTGFLAVAGLVYFSLGSERPWLAWTACGLRTLSLVINFVQTPNLNYREISHLERITVLGEPISVVDGVPRPWLLIGQLSLLILTIYILDAAATAWRRNRDRSVKSRTFQFAYGMVGFLPNWPDNTCMGVHDDQWGHLVTQPVRILLGRSIVRGTRCPFDLVGERLRELF